MRAPYKSEGRSLAGMSGAAPIANLRAGCHSAPLRLLESSCRLAVIAMICAVFPLAAATNDSDAGSWKMIVLTGPAQIAVAAPAPVDDAGYQSELASIKSAQAHLTADQRKAISYWSGNGVVRWNQILMELVSRADLPPEPNADGTYSFPDAANPFAFPQFPFANPPYAARSYSYVSVAQYEALKVAWYYKYLYNRPAPSKADTGIQALAPGNDLPAYPSEDAVLSGVSAALLKILFPTSIDEINQKAAEQQQAALLSGRASPSDIAAGLALGQAVAAVLAARASTDGLKAATGTAAQWQALADTATARGEIPWKSQEHPPRPPMLPFFGSVKTWNMSPEDIVKERPGAPPSTSSARMAKETAEVKAAVDHLTREQYAIVMKWADGASSPTPPGHWNFIADSYVTNAHFTEVRAARVFALLDMAMHDAAVACWDVKYFYFNPRPSQVDPTIKTDIGLPNFPSYTSGHSTFSAAAVVVLSYLFPSAADYFNAQAQEAAISRLYGGIHYRSDIEVGLVHGKAIGGYTVRFAQQDGADPTTVSTVRAGQTLDGASFHSPVVPGSVATVFQADIGSSSTLAASVPLPTSLAGISMKFNDSIAVPFFSAAPNQANIQIPWELQGLSSATLTATSAKGLVSKFAVPLAAFAPAIFTINQQGTGQGIVTLANSSTLAAAPGSIDGAVTRAASRGDYVTIYCVGLGPVNNAPRTGAAAPDASSTTTSPVSVLINGANVPAAFAGLSPGSVGVFQVNVQIPGNAPAGDAVSLALSVGGVTSNVVMISIQ
jgi:uncharacterized protein (TIGR03437 family)